MPKIRLLQERGEYNTHGVIYYAKEIYEVSNQEAFELVNQEKMAEEVTEESERIKNKSVLNVPSNGQLKIAMIRIGGIGDTLLLAIQARAVKRKYPESFITLYIRDNLANGIIDCLGAVDKCVTVGNHLWEGILDKVKKHGHNIIYDNRYITKVYLELEDKYTVLNQEEFELWESYYNEFPKGNNKLTTDHHISEIELMNLTSGLDMNHGDFIINLPASAYVMADLLEGQKYVTIHHGADCGRQTKCWDEKYWEIVVKFLNDNGYKVIQLGQRFEDKISGAINMLNKTTLIQSAALIKCSQFHIDTESGLVHLARMVGTKCIVLFASTPVKFFGYPENINIVSPCTCVSCWWETQMWWRECPKGYPIPTKCMQELKPELVIEAVKSLATDVKTVFKGCGIREDETIVEQYIHGNKFNATKHEWDRIYVMLELLKENSNVMAIGCDEFTLEIMKQRGLNVVQCCEKIDNFFSSESWAGFDKFDSVIIGRPLNQFKSIAQLFTMVETVLNPDGVIVFSVPMSTPAFSEEDNTSINKWITDTHIIYEQGKFSHFVCGLKRNIKNESIS